MDISGKIPPLTKTPYIQKVNNPVKHKPSVPPIGPSDRVALSPQAQELQAARKAVAGMDDMDAEKVARVKARIAAGTYKVDARKIADKMVDEALLSDLG